MIHLGIGQIKIQKQPMEVFYKKDVLKNFAYFQRKIPVLEPIFNKVVEICEIFKNVFFKEHLRKTTSENIHILRPSTTSKFFTFLVLRCRLILWRKLTIFGAELFFLEMTWNNIKNFTKPTFKIYIKNLTIG